MYENLKNKVIFVTGLPGSGKKKFARFLNDKVIFLDEHKYLLHNWVRKDKEKYLNDINEELKKQENEETIVICGNYDDPDDLQNTNINLIHNLANNGCINKVYIMKIVPQINMIASLIKLCRMRYSGEEPSHLSGNIEDSGTVAYYLLLTSNKYTQISNSLINLSRFCVENKIGLRSS